MKGGLRYESDGEILRLSRWKETGNEHKAVLIIRWTKRPAMCRRRVEMVARFTRDKYGWRCNEIYPDDEMWGDVLYSGVALYINVSSAPPLGFCKRPHHYL